MLVIQFTGLPQPVMGPLVNGMLFLAAMLIGPFSAILLGILTPLTAFIRGHLPPFLAVLVPFIAVSNGILVSTFGLLIKVLPDRSGRMVSFRKLISVLVAAILKTGFLFLSVRVLVPLWFGIAIPNQIAFMMATPQLLTAIAGGLVALFFIPLFAKRGIHQRM